MKQGFLLKALLFIFSGYFIICLFPGSTVLQENFRSALAFIIILAIGMLILLLGKRRVISKAVFLPGFSLLSLLLLFQIKKSLPYSFPETDMQRNQLKGLALKISAGELSGESAAFPEKQLIFDYGDSLHKYAGLQSAYEWEINCSFDNLRIFSKSAPVESDPGWSDGNIKVSRWEVPGINGEKTAVICFKLLPMTSAFNIWKNKTTIRRVGAAVRFRESPVLAVIQYEGTAFNAQYKMFNWVARMELLGDLSESRFNWLRGEKIFVLG